MQQVNTVVMLLLLVMCVGCGEVDEIFTEEMNESDLDLTKALNDSEKISRMRLIRERSTRAGLRNGAPLAGIALAETGLAHCWSEATWTCQGPYSSECGGPVVAGAGDGPCWWREGGLGMFQFDAGVFEDTLQREGHEILSLAGNVDRSVEFVVRMLISSPHVNVSDRNSAFRWLEQVRPGTAAFDTWIKIVTHHYNGCEPGYCSIYWDRFSHYKKFALEAFDRVPAGFWTQETPEPQDVTEYSDDDAALEIWWHRDADGRYSFKSIAPQRVKEVRYLVDGYVIGDGVPRDDPSTSAVERNFPFRYRFDVERPQRQVAVEGYNTRGELIALGVGLMDVVSGTGVYIRQIKESVYQVGFERPPSSVVSVSVSVDGYELTPSDGGSELAVRSHFNRLGRRHFVLQGFDASGTAIVRSER